MVKFENSTPESDDPLFQGGAIFARRYNVKITDCEFHGNQAYKGGAISLAGCSPFTCESIIRDSKFTSNTALEAGGAIFYEIRNSPLINNTSTIEFEDNKAHYGNNYASYPKKFETDY
jgi:predicted outer membrane repeat protein